MKLVRKISLAKWQATLKIGEHHLSADAITACLRTQGNTLSLWRSDDAQELDRALMALSASLSSLEKIDYIILESEDIEGSDLKLVSSELDSPAVNAGKQHCDIVELDHPSLARVATLVKREVALGRHSRLDKKKLREILIGGIKSGEIDATSLAPKLKEELGLESRA